jgi:hypothetical protein
VKIRRKARGEWLALMPNAHEGYVNWEKAETKDGQQQHEPLRRSLRKKTGAEDLGSVAVEAYCVDKPSDIILWYKATSSLVHQAGRGLLMREITELSNISSESSAGWGLPKRM